MCCLQMLEKTFYMENPDEVVPEKFVGCTINWAAGKDTTGMCTAGPSCGGHGTSCIVCIYHEGGSALDFGVSRHCFPV